MRKNNKFMENEDEQIRNKLQTILDLISNIQTVEQMRDIFKLKMSR